MKKNIITAILGTTLLLGSCTKDFGEINKNPNVPEDYLTYALFNGNNQALMYNLRGYDNMGKQSLTWMQYTCLTLMEEVPFTTKCMDVV